MRTSLFITAAVVVATEHSLCLAQSLYDKYSSVQFRNPTDHNVARQSDGRAIQPQCVLYSEIDNVSSINKGWDVGSGVGWELGYPYMANGSVPPTGIRSAVPLGGMGTGNFELRADGTFRQWCIESQSPGGGAKLDIGALNDAFIALSYENAGSDAALATLRTNPPGDLPGIDAIKYEGAVPLSKLTPQDSRFPGVEVYAHGEMAPWDTNGSMTPAVAFTLTVSNPTEAQITVGLMVALPLASQPETARAGAATRNHAGAASPLQCKMACDGDTMCRAWTFEEATSQCGFFDGGIPQNLYASGITSGIKGSWTATDHTLQHTRAGPAPAPGPPNNGSSMCMSAPPDVGVDIDNGAELAVFPVAVGAPGIASCRSTCCQDAKCSAWVVADSSAPAGATPPPCTPGKPCCWHKSGQITKRPPCPFCTSGLNGGGGGGKVGGSDEQVGDFAMHVVPSTNVVPFFNVGNSVSDIFAAFKNESSNIDPTKLAMTATHGAAGGKVIVPAHGNATVTVVLGWRFEERYMSGQSIGNYYASLHPTATTAAEGFGTRLAKTVDLINGVHSAFFDADSVPTFLQDTLVNSMSQWRSAFMTRDGRWRQWEAYDCVDLDSVHNDYQRHVPYAIFFPELVMNTMESGWAVHQQPNGMITESLSGGCMGATGTLDGAAGRVMGDVSTVFVIECLEMFEYTGDKAWLTRVFPAIERALTWIIDVGTGGTPLPKRQCCTYDIIDFAGYDHTSFNSFMYLAAMRACVRLANTFGNSALAAKCMQAEKNAVTLIDSSLWNSTSGYYRAWTDAQQGSPPWVMADTLYGQVIANYMHLGENGARNGTWLVSPQSVASHLNIEASFNPSPYGLTVVTMTGRPPSDEPKNNSARGGSDCSAAVAQAKYDSVWMGGAPDWTSLQIELEGGGVGFDTAMEMTKKELDHYRTDLRDQWNIHGLTANDGYGLDGQPWCTAHYGFHMPIHFIPFAMTRQSHVATGTGGDSLTFDPSLPCPYKLPVLVTGGVGLLTCASGASNTDEFTLAVTAGQLDLAMLRVGSSTYSGSPGVLVAGKSITWSQ